MFVIIVAAVAAVGAWADTPRVALVGPPQLVPALKPWSAIVDISRHGRRLDGFRPVFTISTPEGPTRSFRGTELSSGRYRVQVVFPSPGVYSYTIAAPSARSAHGTIVAVPS